MRLIDTSCWTHAIRRKGDPAIRARVAALLSGDAAAWCDAIRLELWKGVGNDWDRQILEQLELTIPSLPITAAVWQRACDLAVRARTSGLNVPAIDLLIHSCAREYGVGIESNDKHFALLDSLK